MTVFIVFLHIEKRSRMHFSADRDVILLTLYCTRLTVLPQTKLCKFELRFTHFPKSLSSVPNQFRGNAMEEEMSFEESFRHFKKYKSLSVLLFYLHKNEELSG